MNRGVGTHGECQMVKSVADETDCVESQLAVGCAHIHPDDSGLEFETLYNLEWNLAFTNVALVLVTIEERGNAADQPVRFRAGMSSWSGPLESEVQSAQARCRWGKLGERGINRAIRLLIPLSQPSSVSVRRRIPSCFSAVAAHASPGWSSFCRRAATSRLRERTAAQA